MMRAQDRRDEYCGDMVNKRKFKSRRRYKQKAGKCHVALGIEGLLDNAVVVQL